MTLETLNKDIRLEHVGFGQYDIIFSGETLEGSDSLGKDLEFAEGLESLEMGIIHAILTGYKELAKNDNPTYTNYGNNAYSQLKANQNDFTEYKIKEYTRISLENIRRIQYIENLEIEAENGIYIITYVVRTITDEILANTITIGG